MEELLETHPYLFPLYFLFMWIAILFILSIIGGWRALAENYLLTGPFVGAKKRFQSLNMERIKFFPAGFSSILTIGANNEGLMLSVLVLFRPFHPPLFIPYSELSGHEKKDSNVYQCKFKSGEKSQYHNIFFNKKCAMD